MRQAGKGNDNMKILTLYYSYGGNTKRIAGRIQKAVGGDIACIETVTPYEGDYNSVVDQGQREVNRGFCPRIKPLAVNVQDYECDCAGELPAVVVHVCHPGGAHLSEHSRIFPARPFIRLRRTAAGSDIPLRISKRAARERR